MVFGKKKDNRVIKNLSPPTEKCNKKVNKGKERVDDNEYIVFSFREDGSFDVVVECNAAKSDSFTSVDGRHGNSKSVSRKLDYGEGAEQVKNHCQIEKNISNSKQEYTQQCDQVYMTPFKEGETINLSPTQHRDNIGRSCQTEKIEDGRLVYIDSRNSNQSEGSRGSFAFPQLACELVESPVNFPKSEHLHLNNEKIRCGRFQCFRF